MSLAILGTSSPSLYLSHEVRALDPSKPRRVIITHAGRTPILNPARPLQVAPASRSGLAPIS